VAEIDYTHGYYRELAPGLLDFALLMSGHEPPRRSGARYLELGYGQGLSANIHAAATEVELWGADFNPVHAANAQDLAQAAGSGAHFSDDSFADFLARDDTPMFDYICLHGIWSWVDDDNRRVIVDILRRKLKVGGVAYLSYNTLPGWSVGTPLRHMLTLHAEAAGSYAQGVVGRVDNSISFGQRLHDAKARFFAINPTAKARLDAIAGQNRNYVAHEYFNDNWAPMYFSEMHAWLEGAKLSYTCAAPLLDQVDAFNLTPEQQAILNESPYTVLRETVRDFLLNSQFRRDLYTRGARPLSALERQERLQATRVMLTVPPEDIRFEIETGLGKIGLKPDIYKPIIEALAEDDAGAKGIGDLVAHPKLAPLGAMAVLESLMVLVGTQNAHPAQTDAVAERVSPSVHKLNASVIERARTGGDIVHLASPILGAAVHVGRFEQMFLAAHARGKKGPEGWAEEAWTELARQGQTILKEGKALEGPEANLAELTAQARTFADKRFALVRRLGVEA
jgi:SAM-dependent methyltransferase